MADKKISALTGATTPLAGTEVLPIVQSGATVNVSVANLTAGRAIVADGLTLSGGTANGVVYLNGSKAATSGSTLTFDGSNLGIGTSSPTAKLQVGVSGGTGLKDTIYAGSYSTDTNQFRIIWNSTGYNLGIGANTSGGMIFGQASAGTGAISNTHMTLDSSGNLGVGTISPSDKLTVTGGNVVMGTAAKGVNFTANTPAAGKTSQLLNWYEEGTCTLGVAFGGGTTGITYGARPVGYVRVGSLVTVTGYIALSNKGSATGAATITGLPFTTASAANGGYAAVSLSASSLTFAGQYSGYTAASGTTVNLYQTSALGVLSTLTDTNFANNTEIEFCITYRCA